MEIEVTFIIHPWHF